MRSSEPTASSPCSICTSLSISAKNDSPVPVKDNRDILAQQRPRVLRRCLLDQVVVEMLGVPAPVIPSLVPVRLHDCQGCLHSLILFNPLCYSSGLGPLLRRHVEPVLLPRHRSNCSKDTGLEGLCKLFSQDTRIRLRQPLEQL